MANTAEKIVKECEEIKVMLLEKNSKYGDSAIHPSRLFSKSSPVEQILVRIDDKISRIMANPDREDEDVIKDLIGYFVLLRIAKQEEREKVNLLER